MSAAGTLDIETYPAVTCPGKPALSINTGRDAAVSDSEPPLSAVAPSFNFKEEFTTAPPLPAPWTWTCHRCHHTYRFSAALNRCLSCSHRFCRECISEYDYDGWDTFRAYYQPESFLNDVESHGHTNYLNPCHIDDSDDEDDYSDRSISPSSSEDEHDEAISPTRISFTSSEAEWLSQKALEIDNAYSPSFHDDERLHFSPWNTEEDIALCGDSRPLRVLNHDDDDEDDEEDDALSMWHPSKSLSPAPPLPALSSPLAVPKRSLCFNPGIYSHSNISHSYIHGCCLDPVMEVDEEDEDEPEEIWREDITVVEAPLLSVSIPQKPSLLTRWGDFYRSIEEAKAVQRELEGIVKRILVTDTSSNGCASSGGGCSSSGGANGDDAMVAIEMVVLATTGHRMLKKMKSGIIG